MKHTAPRNVPQSAGEKLLAARKADSPSAWVSVSVSAQAKRWFLRALLFCFCLVLPAVSARPYTAGPYLVEVGVFNQAWYPIIDARVQVRLAKDKIIVQARSAGYVGKRVELARPAGNAVLYVNLVLEDRKKTFTIIDLNGEPIESAYLQTDQFGFSPKIFGLQVFIPKENWPNPSCDGVAVFDYHWGAVDSLNEVEPFEEFYRVTLHIPRRELDRSATEWYVVIETELEPSEKALHTWLSRLASDGSAREDAPPDGGRNRFIRFLADAFPSSLYKLLSSGILPADLERLIAGRARFDALHQTSRRN